MGYIYKVVNKVNGKVYIGQTHRDIPTRWSEHIKYAKSPPKKCGRSILRFAIQKYGAENFEVEELEQCDDSILDEREIYWIKKYNSVSKGYNLAVGGKGGQKYSKEEILYWWNQGLSMKQIASHISLHPETIAKHLKHAGISQQEILDRGNDIANKKKIKPLYQYDLDGNFVCEYPSITDAMCITGINHIHINANKAETTGGYQWKRFKADRIAPISQHHKSKLKEKSA